MATVSHRCLQSIMGPTGLPAAFKKRLNSLICSGTAMLLSMCLHTTSDFVHLDPYSRNNMWWAPTTKGTTPPTFNDDFQQLLTVPTSAKQKGKKVAAIIAIKIIQEETTTPLCSVHRSKC